LNVFSNLRRLDAFQRILPGHDLVNERNGLYSNAVAWACRKQRMPYVLFLDADEVMEHDFLGTPITGILRWRAKRTLQYNLDTASRVIVVSAPARANLVQNWNVPEEKIALFPNAVDVQGFQESLEIRRETRAELGLESNPIVIFVGRFYAWHDVSTLLKGFGQLLAKCPDARLVLVGDGSRRSEMMQLASDLEISRTVHFMGQVTHRDVPGLLSSADIAVAPYPRLKQGLWLSPMKLYEYMAAGKAIVTSGVGQSGQPIRDGENGLLVPPEDPSALAAAFQRLIEDEHLRSNLGRKARADAIREYSWDQYLTRLERLYVQVIPGDNKRQNQVEIANA
jgi:glycosyltransferase involved in cell wall biosynthesis